MTVNEHEQRPQNCHSEKKPLRVNQSLLILLVFLELFFIAGIATYFVLFLNITIAGKLTFELVLGTFFGGMTIFIIAFVVFVRIWYCLHSRTKIHNLELDSDGLIRTNGSVIQVFPWKKVEKIVLPSRSSLWPEDIMITFHNGDEIGIPSCIQQCNEILFAIKREIGDPSNN